MFHREPFGFLLAFFLLPLLQRALGSPVHVGIRLRRCQVAATLIVMMRLDFSRRDLFQLIGKIEHLGGRQLTLVRNLLHLLLGQTQRHVLWLQVCVDDLTDSMKVIQPHQTLLRHDPNQGHRAALVVVAFDDFKKVDTKDLEDEDKVFAVLAMVKEAVEQLDAVTVVTCNMVQLILISLVVIVLLERVEPFFFHPVAGHLVEDFDLVECSVEVMRCRSLDLKRDIRVVHDVLGEPNSREMAPAKLLNDKVTIDQDFADMHGVVATDFIVGETFVFRAVSVFVALG